MAPDRRGWPPLTQSGDPAVGYSNPMPSRVRLVSVALLMAATCPLVACSRAAPSTPASISADSAITRGRLVIVAAGTYDYALTTRCQSFKFTSDSGRYDWLDPRGAVYLTAGTWSGSCYHEVLSTQSSSPLPCVSPATAHCAQFYAPTHAQKVSDAWSLALTPVGSSY